MGPFVAEGKETWLILKVVYPATTMDQASVIQVKLELPNKR